MSKDTLKDFLTGKLVKLQTNLRQCMQSWQQAQQVSEQARMICVRVEGAIAETEADLKALEEPKSNKAKSKK